VITNPPKNHIKPVAKGRTSFDASGLGTNIETSIRKVPAPIAKTAIFPTVVNLVENPLCSSEEI
jgi:hypothetical protein